jgi:hypothetical protein
MNECSEGRWSLQRAERLCKEVTAAAQTGWLAQQHPDKELSHVSRRLGDRLPLVGSQRGSEVGEAFR